MRSFSKYTVTLLLIIISAALSSCGSKYTGWAVLYIEDSENGLEAGTVFPVLQESDIRDAYTIEAAGHDTGLDIARWKMSFHEKEDDARQFAADYTEWIDIYAVTLLNGLSIRESADSSSERIYKLREGQTVKIIGRNEQMVNIADHDGYWYSVLTEDGTSGYCFDKNLRMYNAREEGAGITSVLDTELLQTFYNRAFRPEYFKDMIRENRIDLSRFRTTRGIFAYPEEKKIVLSLKDMQQVFEYTSVSQNSSGRFIFEGSSLMVEMRGENTIAIYYNHNSKEYAEVMVYISNIEELIEAEIERRKLLFEQIAELGSVSSSAYGRIIFEENRAFRWTNYKRLVPGVLPESAGENGRLEFNYFPGLNTEK